MKEMLEMVKLKKKKQKYSVNFCANVNKIKTRSNLTMYVCVCVCIVQQVQQVQQHFNWFSSWSAFVKHKSFFKSLGLVSSLSRLFNHFTNRFFFLDLVIFVYLVRILIVYLFTLLLILYAIILGLCLFLSFVVVVAVKYRTIIRTNSTMVS